MHVKQQLARAHTGNASNVLGGLLRNHSEVGTVTLDCADSRFPRESGPSVPPERIHGFGKADRLLDITGPGK